MLLTSGLQQSAPILASALCPGYRCGGQGGHALQQRVQRGWAAAARRVAAACAVDGAVSRMAAAECRMCLIVRRTRRDQDEVGRWKTDRMSAGHRHALADESCRS